MRKCLAARCWFIILIIVMHSTANAAPKLEKLWLLEGLQVPESVLYYNDGKATFLYVSQIDGGSNTVDGKGGIAKVTETGELVNLSWVVGLNAPKGMGVFDGKLYVADISEVLVIDIKSAKIEQKISVAGAIFLNDIAIDPQGSVYVSDTRTNKVHRIQNGVVEDYLVNVASANGLKFMGNTLVVGAATQLLLVDKEKNRLPLATGFAQAIDGVEVVGRKGLIVSCWAGMIYFAGLDGHLELLLDSQQEKINTADIAYNAKAQTLFVPNFAKNTVTAYHLALE
jgi:hypothetical protein